MLKSNYAGFIVKSIALSVLGVGASQAGLIDRGGGLIYDDVKDVTWLWDTQYARSSGYSSDGLLDWQDANSFAQSLDYYDRVRETTWSDWRLPTAVSSPQAGGYDPTGENSELAYMYYVNLGLAPVATDGSGVKNTTIKTDWFANLVGRAYWTGTAVKPNRSAWEFQFGYGLPRRTASTTAAWSGWCATATWALRPTASPSLARWRCSPWVLVVPSCAAAARRAEESPRFATKTPARSRGFSLGL